MGLLLFLVLVWFGYMLISGSTVCTWIMKVIVFMVRLPLAGIYSVASEVSGCKLQVDPKAQAEVDEIDEAIDPPRKRRR